MKIKDTCCHITNKGKVFDFFVVIQDELGMRAVMLRGKFGDVVSLIIIFARKLSRCLGFVPAEITSCCVGEVLGLVF
jgi:hypothetical protein